MADKEIIIDGVDVSGCKHQYNEKCNIDYEEWNNEIIRYNECHNNPNCYFKQLKHKEQECEELHKQVEVLTMQLENLNKKILRKRAVVEFADCPNYSYGDNTIEPTCTKNFCYDIKSCNHKNMVKYKQTLDEIEEIAKHNNFLVKDPFCGTGYRDLSGQILNIINKVKN